MATAQFALTCRDCGEGFTAGTTVAERCPACRVKHTNARRRHAPKKRACERCGKDWKPYHDTDKYCDDCAKDAYADRAKGRSGARDEQMEKLFRYYKSRENVVIDEAPDGARVVVVSDHQFPFVDEAFLEAEYLFIEDWKPNYIIYAGDVVDAYEISDFDKRPERLFNFETELLMAREMMETHKRLAPTAKLYFAEGNHEERLQRAIWKHSQGFSFLVDDLPKALGLETITEGFVPYGKHIDFLGFVITHGTIARKHSAYTAKAMMDAYRSSGANGHTHRAGSHSHSDHRGRSHTWFELGCHCRRDLEYVKSAADWQHALLTGVVYDNALHPNLVRVIETSNGRGFVGPNEKHYHIKEPRK